MNRKTNISVQNNVGRHINPNIIIDDKYRGYQSGDILDANSVQHKIEDIIGLVPEEFDTLQEIVDELQKKQDIIQDLSTIRSGAAKGDTAYQKPSSGIPSTDMTTTVQASLEKAEAAAPQSNVYTKSETDTLLDTKSNKNGYYESMGVGTANNLRGSDVAQGTFIRRTAGGTADIASGNAYIEGVQGNEIVWNQLIANGNFESTTGWAGITSLSAGVATSFRDGTGSTDANTTGINQGTATAVVSGHKYYFRALLLSGNSDTKVRIRPTNSASYGYSATQVYSQWTRVGYIWTATITSIYPNLQGVNYDGTDVEFSAQDFCMFDLTLMFGTGNEPTTVAEVEAWLAQYVGYKNYYPYDAGTLLPMKMKAMRTVGFNQWNEQWEVGGYDLTTGAKKVSTVTIRSKEYIPIFPNTIYYCNAYNYGGTYAIRLLYYDANKNFLSTVAADGTFTTPVGAYYMNFTLRTEYGITYNNDICINLQWSGIRDGEYEPYWEEVTALDVTGITGINPNTNQRETIFPDGMRGKGDWADVIYQSGGNAVAVKKAGRVDLGNCVWTIQNQAAGRYFTTDADYLSLNNNAIQNSIAISNVYVPNYNVATGDAQGLGLWVNGGQKQVRIMLDALVNKTVQEVAEAMLGVMLEYSLATPITYTDLQYVDGKPFTLPVGYKVDDFGTEEIITPTSTAGEPTSCAPTISVRYGVNAVDPLRRLPQTYISKESMEAFLATLGSAMNGTWAMTWDGSNGKYSYVFTPNAEPEHNNE